MFVHCLDVIVHERGCKGRNEHLSTFVPLLTTTEREYGRILYGYCIQPEDESSSHPWLECIILVTLLNLRRRMKNVLKEIKDQRRYGISFMR